jgi:hypothetical protein
MVLVLHLCGSWLCAIWFLFFHLQPNNLSSYICKHLTLCWKYSLYKFSESIELYKIDFCRYPWFDLVSNFVRYLLENSINPSWNIIWLIQLQPIMVDIFNFSPILNFIQNWTQKFFHDKGTRPFSSNVLQKLLYL